MRNLKLPVLGLIALLAACSGEQTDEIVGKWKRSDNGEVLEFAKDGTVTRVTTIRTGTGPDHQITSGGTYHFPEDGKIQLSQDIVGPVNMGFEMMTDSLYMTGLDGQRQKYYRDTGETPALTFQLATADGQPVPHVHEQRITRPGGGSFTEKTQYTEGTLTLDPLTHTFSQTLRIEYPGWVSTGPPEKYLHGSYTLDGDSLTLRYARDSEAPPLGGTLQGERLTHHTYVRSPSPRDPQKFHPGPVLGYVRQ